MRRWLFACTVALLSALAIACGPDYNKTMSRKVSQALGSDYDGYQQFSYPTSNFGLSTAYTPQDGRDEPNDRDFLCDMWNCIGVPDDKIPTDTKQVLAMNGFAAVGDNGAIIALTEKEKTELALNVALPEIYGAINVGGGFERSQVTNTTMTLGRAFPRKLRRTEMTSYINGLPNTNPMKQAFQRGDLVLVVADVVMESMKVDVEVNAAGKQSLDAALGKDIGAAGKIIGNSKLGVKASQSTEGKYSFEITRPVILKRLAKRQPGAGVLGNAEDDDWKDWLPKAIPVAAR